MRAKLSVVFSVLVLVVSSLAQPPAPTAEEPTLHFDGNSWWSHVKVLADDKMEGRQTGSRGERQAEAYAVKVFSQAGLEAAGTHGFYQPMKFTARTLVMNKSSAALVRDGAVTPLAIPDDVLLATNVDLPAKAVEAPLVFVGYGLRIPEENYDDFAGLDLKGKVVVFFSGSPANIPAALSAHYQSNLERWKTVRKTGAIGMIRLMNPAAMDIPWKRIEGYAKRPHLVLADAEFDETAGQKVGLFLNPAKAPELFAGSGHSYEELVGAAKKRDPLPHFPLKVSVKAHAVIKTKSVTSSNVVAKLPGSDPQLRDQYVVMSAHIDHLGIGQPINGDKIYNGAMDNASGVALLLDLANELKKSQTKLRRSVLFIAVTGEEEGLLGSRYFAAYPTVNRSAMVADINSDMFLPIVPLKVINVFGLEESNLGVDIREVASSLGVKVQPDPEPLRNIFIRSDQYSFVRDGVPSIFLDVGFEKGSPDQELFKQWLKQRYHAPSDDLNQPINLKTAAEVEEIYRDLLIKVANSDPRPQWNRSSFFRRFAAP